jgi:hypothetical protein
MSVKTQITLDKYNPHQIIQFIKDGIITLDEVIASGVAHRCFSNTLSDYIWEKSQDIINNLEVTVIAENHTIIDLGFVA